MIDSSKWEIIEEGLKWKFKAKGIVNSDFFEKKVRRFLKIRATNDSWEIWKQVVIMAFDAVRSSCAHFQERIRICERSLYHIFGRSNWFSK